MILATALASSPAASGRALLAAAEAVLPMGFERGSTAVLTKLLTHPNFPGPPSAAMLAGAYVGAALRVPGISDALRADLLRAVGDVAGGVHSYLFAAADEPAERVREMFVAGGWTPGALPEHLTAPALTLASAPDDAAFDAVAQVLSAPDPSQHEKLAIARAVQHPRLAELAARCARWDTQGQLEGYLLEPDPAQAYLQDLDARARANTRSGWVPFVRNAPCDLVVQHALRDGGIYEVLADLMAAQHLTLETKLRAGLATMAIEDSDMLRISAPHMLSGAPAGKVDDAVTRWAQASHTTQHLFETGNALARVTADTLGAVLDAFTVAGGDVMPITFASKIALAPSASQAQRRDAVGHIPDSHTLSPHARAARDLAERIVTVGPTRAVMFTPIPDLELLAVGGQVDWLLAKVADARPAILVEDVAVAALSVANGFAGTISDVLDVAEAITAPGAPTMKDRP